MKKPWIIPALISLLLLLAWPFRWEKGPTQTTPQYAIVYLKDRWTGQEWIKIYSPTKKIREIPNIEKKEVEARVNEILLKSPDMANIRSKIEQMSKDPRYTPGPSKFSLSLLWSLSEYGFDTSKYYNQAKEKALNEIINETMLYRNIATWVWSSLLLISLITLFYIKFKETRKKGYEPCGVCNPPLD
ncbi:hypothetical protein CTH_10010 (plasmid) [Carboxydocella thermautotrophica]|nr:hypothetical protein CTH_10010 [Carboxydocella thermautotrophica]